MHTTLSNVLKLKQVYVSDFTQEREGEGKTQSHCWPLIGLWFNTSKQTSTVSRHCVFTRIWSREGVSRNSLYIGKSLLSSLLCCTHLLSPKPQLSPYITGNEPRNLGGTSAKKWFDHGGRDHECCYERLWVDLQIQKHTGCGLILEPEHMKSGGDSEVI